MRLAEEISAMEERLKNALPQLESQNYRFDEIDIARMVKEMITLLNKARVAQLQYDNLRYELEPMCTEILGKNYYNTALDIYNADHQTISDMRREIRSGFFGGIAAKLRARRYKKNGRK